MWVGAAGVLRGLSTCLVGFSFLESFCPSPSPESPLHGQAYPAQGPEFSENAGERKRCPDLHLSVLCAAAAVKQPMGISQGCGAPRMMLPTHSALPGHLFAVTGLTLSQLSVKMSVSPSRRGKLQTKGFHPISLCIFSPARCLLGSIQMTQVL